MQSLALVLLAAFPFLGALLFVLIKPGQSFARRYSRARKNTAAMTAAADLQRQRNQDTAARLRAGRSPPGDPDA
jgi:hypothetical protein